MSNRSMMDIMYGTKAGRAILCGLLKAGLPKAMAAYLHSPLSKPMIKKYIREYGIDMSQYEAQEYSCFADFFIRKRIDTSVCDELCKLISPCDSMLSMFPISADSVFGIKGSEYRIADLTGDSEAAQRYAGGTCLIFRLRAQDYHRYCFIDGGYVHENRYFEGELHSVQPIACAHFPVYRLNRRMCTYIDTDNFSTVAQIEVGAMAVGGINNPYENCRVEKGQEMGRFELCGSTIVMLFEPGRIELSGELLPGLHAGDELPVHYGEAIGSVCPVTV